MKLVIVDVTNYKPIDQYFTGGEHYYLVEDGLELETKNKIDAWAKSLGPCLDGRPHDHWASEHISVSFANIEELPEFIKDFDMDEIGQILKQLDWYEIHHDPVTLRQIRLELQNLQKEIEDVRRRQNVE
jgi:hypothetical protein